MSALRPTPDAFSSYAIQRVIWRTPAAGLFVVGTQGGRLSLLKWCLDADLGPPPRASAWIEGLRRLSQEPGWLEILDAGLGPEPGAFWYVTALADTPSGPVPVPETPLPGDYLPGDLRSGIPLPTQTVLDLGVRLGSALATLHDHGLVHRDLKPANLLRFRGEVCIAGYDQIREVSAGPIPGAGTEGYRPSEGGGTYASDIHALGRTLYELWTGLDGLNFPSLPRGFTEREDWKGFGAHLNRVLLRACDPSPSARFATMREFGDALREVAGGQAAARLRHRRRVFLVGALVGLGGMGLPLVLGRGCRPNPLSPPGR